MNRKSIIFFAVVALAGAATLPATQQNNKKAVVAETARNNSASPADAKAAPVPATADPTTYVIGAEDVLDISVWKEPDVSRAVPVRPDGRISLPLINDVQAAGLTPQQLATTVTEKLRKYLNEPQVTVIVTAMNSQRIFVVGEVLRAGAFPLLPGMTVLQALSSAGGFSTFADVKRIHVIRSHDGKHAEIPFNYRDVLKGDNPEQNIKLEPGDTIVVP